MTRAPDLSAYRLFASALAGRSVDLTHHHERHQRAFTDGHVIAVPAAHSLEEAFRAITVQACLIAEGALDAAIMRALRGHPRWAERYLCLEAVRCVRARAALVPDAALSLPAFHCDGAVSSGARQSLQAAASARTLAAPPACFGLLVPGRVLRQQRATARAQAASSSALAGAQPEHADADASEESRVLKAFRSPVQQTLNLLGNLVDQIFQRRPDGAASAAADAGLEGSAGSSGLPLSTPRRVRRALGAPGLSPPPAQTTDGSLCYPEWDEARARYRPRHVQLAEVEPAEHERAPLPWAPATLSSQRRLRRGLSRLGLELASNRHQLDGDELVIDDVVRWRTEQRAGHAGDERMYASLLRTRRDLGVLVLVDLSASTADPGPDGVSVFQSQLGLARSLTRALDDSGDRVALYGFHSWGRSIVRMQRIKSFDERLSSGVSAKLSRLRPVGYSRLGAAVRHSVTLLRTRARSSKWLLVLISDALAYDRDGYEGSYARADTRRALLEARARGVACVCVSMRAERAREPVSATFGQSRQLCVDRLQRAAGPLVSLFQKALADLRSPAGAAHAPASRQRQPSSSKR